MQTEKNTKDMLAIISLILLANLVGYLLMARTVGTQCEKCRSLDATALDPGSPSFWAVT